MNLSSRWCGVLQTEGWWDSVHSFQIAIASAPDHEVMCWPLADHRIGPTHNLDDGAILADAQAAGPGVVQVRTQDVRPELLALLLISVLPQHEN